MILFVRHGETALNKSGKIRGWLDVPISEKGLEEARVAAKDVKALHLPITKIYCSDLQRTVKTARIISEEIGTPQKKMSVNPTKRLRPWDLGVYAGKDAKKSQNALEHYIDKENEKVPSGESFHSFLARFIPFIEELQQSKDTVLCVTHIRNILVVRAWSGKGLKINKEKMWDPKNTVEPGGIAKLEDGHFSILEGAKVSHTTGGS